MTKIEDIKRKSFMVMFDMAFINRRGVDNIPFLEVINLKNTSQYLICGIYDGELRFRETNMSETNKYKVLLYIERNKKVILSHCR